MIQSIDSAEWREANRWEVSLTARNDNRGGTPPGQGRKHDRRARLDGEEPLVLVVEDDRAIREPLCVLLRGEGYRVSLAENGQEACASSAPSPAPTSSCSICACR